MRRGGRELAAAPHSDREPPDAAQRERNARPESALIAPVEHRQRERGPPARRPARDPLAAVGLTEGGHFAGELEPVELESVEHHFRSCLPSAAERSSGQHESRQTGVRRHHNAKQRQHQRVRPDDNEQCDLKRELHRSAHKPRDGPVDGRLVWQLVRAASQ